MTVVAQMSAMRERRLPFANEIFSAVEWDEKVEGSRANRTAIVRKVNALDSSRV